MGNLLEHPPKVRLTLRIGVTGHRDQALEKSKELNDAVLKVLVAIQGIADRIALGAPFAYESQTECRVVSALAEGADRAVARVGKAALFPLDYILPYHRGVYKETFDGGPESKNAFDALLADAGATILELDGGPKDRREAFGELADALIANCDVLLAIWNGGPSEGIGGTRDVVERSMAKNIPVVWFDPKNSRPPRVLESLEASPRASDQLVEANLEERLSRAFTFDPGIGKTVGPFRWLMRKFGRDDSERGKAKNYFGESTLWQLESPALVAQWKSVWSSLNEAQQTVHAPISTAFMQPFAWVDRLAKRYGFLYRWSIRANLVLGAAVVLLAYFGHCAGSSGNERLTIWELGLVLAILGITSFGWLQRWHERWLDYRWLAEVLRQTNFLVPLAWLRPPFRAPAHLRSGEKGPRWLALYSGSMLRQAPLPKAKINAEYLEYCRAAMVGISKDQLAYHAGRADRLGRSAHRLHELGVACFVYALLGCVLHLKHFGTEPWLGLMVVVLPAFASASGAVLHHGEYRQQIAHSKALVGWLTEATEVWEAQVFLERKAVEANADALSEAMMDELADWRDAFVDKPIPMGH